MDHPPVGFDEEPPPEPREGWLLVRIHVPEVNVHKCLQFPSERLVWDVKQQVLASLPKELKESFNYGLFCPPLNGKAGKFLDEERRLGDYPFNGPVGYLELKYKRRVYKMLNLDEKQLKAVHTRANLRRFVECINGGHVDKIAKMCAKGLDPNFHCPETGDTPLTLATGAKKPNKLLIALVNGGALLDYRTKDGTTALHRAVERDCLEAVTTLLELGASPNYKDARGLTPLYLSITKKTDSKICESLLHDHGTLGIHDSQGWQEVHQACRHGLVQHLEHLLFYGADMDGHNASGNTPLHVCAVNNQEACARMLLFRAAQRDALNYANQTPYQVAVIAGNMELAEMIQSYKSEDIVPFRGPPRYNPRRRSGIGWGTTLSRIGGPPSPCPSEHPFSSASSSLSEGSSSHRSHEDDIVSIVTDKSIGDTSDIISDSSGVGTNSDSAACSIGHPSSTVVCMQPYTGSALGHLSIQPGDVIDVVGSTDCGLLEGFVRGVNRSGYFPEHCVQEVNIRQKNIHNVSTASAAVLMQQQPSTSSSSSSVVSQQQQQQQQQQQHQPSYSSATAPRIKKSSMTDARTVVLHRAQRGFGFILRGAKAASPLMQLKPSERCPGLQYLDHVDPGGVADMAGLRPGDFLLEINGEDVRCASHEQVVDLIRNSKSLVSMTVVSQNFPNNFQHQISQQQQQKQQQQQHQQQQYQVPAIGQYSQNGGGSGSMSAAARQCATLPRKMGNGSVGSISVVSGGSGGGGGGGGGRSPAPQPPRRDPKTTLSVGRARAKSMVAGLDNGGESARPAQLVQQHSCIVGLHHALNDGDDDDCDNDHDHDNETNDSTGGGGGHHQHHPLHTHHGNDNQSSSAESIHHSQSLSSASTPTQTGPGTPVQPRTASIKARPTSSRITAAELEELFQRQQGESGHHHQQQQQQHGQHAGGNGNGGSAAGSIGSAGGGSVNSHRYSTMMSSSRFQSGTDSGAATPPAAGSPLKGGGGIVYASVAEMKRKKAAASASNGGSGGSGGGIYGSTGGSKTGTLRGKPVSIPIVTAADLKRTFHSTPDLAAIAGGPKADGGVNAMSSSSIDRAWSNTTATSSGAKGHRSQDDIHRVLVHSHSMQRLVLPPPTHPPPPPPPGAPSAVVGQLVKVDVSRGSEYESTVRLQKQLQDKQEAANAAAAIASMAAAAAAGGAGGEQSSSTDDAVRSSFKPTNSAKLYASPQDIRAVAFRAAKVEPPNAGRHTLRKSVSLRTDDDVAALGSGPMSPPALANASNGHHHHQQQPTSAYAPAGYATTSNSAKNEQQQQQLQQLQLQHQQQQQQQSMATNRYHSLPSKMLQAPPIPDPDYSLSESDGETENSILVAHNTKMNAQIGSATSSAGIPPPPPPLMADFSYSSSGGGSSNGGNGFGNISTSTTKAAATAAAATTTSAMSHSFSVDELQKMRVKLKPSKSYPNELLAQSAATAAAVTVTTTASHHHLSVDTDAADNSSSGVSSDQEIMTANATPSPIPPSHHQHQHQHQHHQPSLPQHQPPPILKTSQAYQQQYSLNNANNNNNSNSNSTTATVEFGILKKQQPPQQQQQTQQQHHYHHQHHHHHQPVKTIDMDREAALQAAAAAAKAAATRKIEHVNDNDRDDNDDDDDGLDDRDDDHHERNDMDSPSPPSKGFQRHNSLTRKQAATIAMNRAMQARTATVVSLVKLPPPIESDDADDTVDHAHRFVHQHQHHSHHHHGHTSAHQPMQKMVQLHSIGGGTLRRPTSKSLTKIPANGGGNVVSVAVTAAAAENIVLAPPPQFCDCVHQPDVVGGGVGGGAQNGGGSSGRAGARIVGALPKVNTNVNVVNELLYEKS